MTYEFDEALAATGPNAEVNLPERWTMGPGFLHGGYLMSVALAAATDTAAHVDPVTMTAHFVRPGKVGTATVATRVVKEGQALSTVEADVVQEGKVCVATITTFGDLSGATEIRFQSVPFPDLPDPENCVPADRSQNDLIPRMVDNLDLLLAPSSVAFALGATLEEARMEGWVGFADGRPIDCISLPMFADALPPPVFNVGAFAPWTPTVELTVHIRRRPSGSRLGVAFHTELIGGTFFESSGTLWNEEGQLVAMSRQLQLIRRP
ncbi:MAG: thioesterase family protein [Acidimicrobiia bacterium]